jgi:CBS domain-containing protein
MSNDGRYVMGLLSTVVSFGAGYVAGMRVGDKPVVAARDAVDRARGRASAITSRAAELTNRATGAMASGSRTQGTIDVRDVREVMTATPETLEVEDTLRDAAMLMDRADIGSVIVTDGTKIVGIVTDRDIALRGVGAGLDPSTSAVRLAMTAAPVTVQPTASVQEAIDVMRAHDVRRVPVVESGRPIGVVSLADLAMTPQARSLLADISTAPPNN